MDPAVKIHCDAEILPTRFSHGTDSLDDLVQLGGRIDVVQLRTGVHLDCLISLRLFLFCRGGHLGGLIASDPGVNLHSLPHDAAQELVNTQSVPFSFEIPESLINSGNCAHQHWPAPVESSPVKYLP